MTSADDRTGPQRTCVGCRRRRAQTALVRCALTPDGRAVVDRHAPGRGAWLCVPPDECFELAVRRRAFARAWRRPVELAALDALRGALCALPGRNGSCDELTRKVE